MGISNSWFAMRGLPRDEALAALGLETGPKIGREWPGRQLAFGELPDGWLLFLHPELDGAFAPEFVELSRHGPAAACAVDERVMYQEARGYSGGVETWRVLHDPNKAESLYHLEVTGSPPVPFETLRSEAIKEQDAKGGDAADVDIISDVPIDLVKSICGFRHDDEWPAGLSFNALRRTGSGRGDGAERPGLFRRLFGRR